MPAWRLHLSTVGEGTVGEMPRKLQKAAALDGQQDPATGLWILNRSGKRANMVPFRTMAGCFADARERVASDPAVNKVIQEKIFEALCGWAIMKMGPKRELFVKEALENYSSVCALKMAAEGLNVGDVIKLIPFEFPLRLTRKRIRATELLADIFLMAAEYEEVRDAVEAVKNKVKTAAHFRLVVREALRQLSAQEKLSPPPEKRWSKKLQNYQLHTSPSQVAFDYVGCRRGVSGPAIKKLVSIAKNPVRMNAWLQKFLQRSYLPKNLDATVKSLTSSPLPSLASK